MRAPLPARSTYTWQLIKTVNQGMAWTGRGAGKYGPLQRSKGCLREKGAGRNKEGVSRKDYKRACCL